MSKYDPLARWLKNQSADEVTVSVQEIERIIADPLPESARYREAWWANDDPDKTRHVQSHAWTLEGWRAYPRLAEGRVVFKRSN